MSVIITYQGGDGVTTLSTSQFCGFFGSAFGVPIEIGQYQEKTFVTDNSGTVNYGELPNVMKVSSNSGVFGSSAAEQSISSIDSSECTLKIIFSSGSAFYLQAVRLIAFDGVTETVAPSGSIVYGVEKGDSNWTLLSGSNSPLFLTPHTGSADTVHEYYIGLSATAQATGPSTAIKFRLYAEYY